MKFRNTNLKFAFIAPAILFAAYMHLSATTGFVQKWMPRFTTFGFFGASATGFSDDAPLIEVALLLDTSNSMDGLIEQAKSQLWKILNELTLAKKDGRIPNLQIALYEYGNSRLSASDGYIRQVQYFTGDMDRLSEKLFSLTTSGGEEYCGQVIHASINELKWSADPGDLRLIYIAGNEPFTQGPVPYAQACAGAKEKDVFVNTIYCGDHEEGIRGHWQSGAMLGKGSYSNIDHNSITAFIETPYDERINQLNLNLNATYITYGAQVRDFQANQAMQDENALKYSKANMADRALFKSSANYTNANWDLVDAYKEDKEILAREKESLPDSLQQLSAKQLEAEVQRFMQLREDIRQEIQELGKKRRAYIEAEQAKMADDATNNLGSSILKALREQAKRKGFVME